MNIKEIQQYAEVRTKARAYLCYIMSRNISASMSHGNIEKTLEKLSELKKAISGAEVVYALDSNGVQISDNISDVKRINGIGKGQDRSDRAYYYRTLQEHRCSLTDPYPSMLSNTMVVTSSFPVYDENDNLLYVICVDIPLAKMLKMVHPTSIDSWAGMAGKVAYSAFSFALALVALLLFIKGISAFLYFGIGNTNR